MNMDMLSRWAAGVTLAAASLFLVDLFLGWQKVSVEVAGAVNVEEQSSGWSGWGFVAGIFAILLLVFARVELRGDMPARSYTFAAGVVPIGLVVATALAVFSGDASVDVANGTVAVEVDTTLWPAWVGLALALIAAAAALVPVVAGLRDTGPRGVVPAARA